MDGFVVIPEFEIRLRPLSKEAKEIKRFDESNKKTDIKSKLGGVPDFIKDEVWPNCSECGIKMTFYAQLAPIGPDYPICNNSMVYVFLCFDCYEAKSIIHSFP